MTRLTTAALLLVLARDARGDDEARDAGSAADDEAPTEPWRAPAAEPSRPTTPEPQVVVVSPPPPERAPPPEPPPPPAPPAERTPVHRAEVWVGATIFPAALRDLRFTGSGTRTGATQRATVQHTGRELGLQNPTFWGPEFGLGYRHTNLRLAASAAFGGNHGTDATVTNAQAAAQFGTSSVRAYGGGLELFGAVPLGRFTLSAGAAAGVRVYSMPLVGFDLTTCENVGGRSRRAYPCAETATTRPAFYVQPRVRLDVDLDARRFVFIGAYVGLDALGDRSILGGAMFGVRWPGS